MKKIINDFIEFSKDSTNITISSVNYNDISYKIIYMQQFVDIRRFNFEVKPSISKTNYQSLSNEFVGLCENIKEFTQNNLEYLLYSGKILLFFDNFYYSFEYALKPKRTPSKSFLDPEDPIGSRDNLIEDLADNLTLIKKRIKSNQLIIKKYQLGLFSKTDCALLYMNNNYDKHTLSKVLKKLKSIDAESINNINDLAIYYQENSFVPLVFTTGSPELISSSLVKGRIVLMIDNSPVALILPTTFTTFTIGKNYINSPLYYTIFNHLFLSIFFMFAIFFLGLFIAIINFHPDVLSITFLNSLKITERGTNWPMFIEVMIVFFLFEFYRFSTSRSTNNYIQNIIIILGGLFIGQNAIQSGTIGATILFLTSISYIAVFAVTNNIYLITSINIFRLFILILSYTMGIIGFIISSMIVILYLFKPTNDNLYYLYPIMPFSLKDFKKFFKPNNTQTKVTK